MKKSVLALLPLLAASPLSAHIELQRPIVMPPRPGVIFVVPAKAEKERAIEISEASVKTRLVGPLAETSVTLVFHNPNSRPMEGELSYPLPPDATLQGYALDVNGKMVDGVPVPKQKARVAFEEEQRKGIDPGLAEWSGGNRFKTRISPIPAHGQRTITLRYTTMVQQNGGTASYRLPLDFEKVGVFKLRIEALTEQQPQVHRSGLGNLSFAPWQTHFVLEREWKDLALKEDLVIDLPQGMADAPAVEKHGDTFYLAKLIPAPQVQQSTLPKPAYVDLIWDSSASMEKVDKEPIFETLRLYFEQNPDCIVRLTLVKNEVCPAPEWHDKAKLLEALRHTRYDGATTDIPMDIARSADMCLLVTDGQVTFGGNTGPAAAEQGKGLVYAFVASSGTDQAALRRWGAVPIDLLRQTPAQALANIPSVQLAGVELDGKPWEGALTNAPSGVVDGQLLLTGTLPAGKHEVCVIFRTAEGEKRVNFSVDTAQAAEGQLNRSFYAQNKLASLLLQPETPARGVLLRQLGEEYGVVTPGTSLLVLENIGQYLTHEVRPPACCPGLRADYDARIARRTKENAQRRENELQRQKERALAERKAVQAWYERDFEKNPISEGEQGGVPRPLMTGAAAGARMDGMVRSRRLASNAVAPQAAPAPAPVVAEDDSYDEDSFAAEDEEGALEPVPAPVSMAAVTIEAAEAHTGAALDVGMGLGAPGAPAAPTAGGPAIRMQAWSSNAPYIAAIKAAANDVDAYYEQRRQYAASPGFFLDCADYFEQAGQRTMAVQVLSNLLEMDVENRSLMRAAAYKLRYMGETEKAITLFRKVLELFPEEPQSYRDLALALADAKRWQEAADVLKLVFEKPMSGRFHGMEQVAAVELAHIVARAQQEGKPVETAGIAPEYLKPIEADLRVVINWDTDMSDMDLWVTDPKKEKCFYGHQKTRTGGLISRDVTQGYGPEQYFIRKALRGDYKVEAHYYGTGSLKMLAPVTLYAELYTDYGRPTEKKQTLIFRLDGRDQVVHIADLAHGSDPAAPATRDYQVRAGDSWESIAARELGNPARAADIIALNPGAKADVPPAKGSIIRLPHH